LQGYILQQTGREAASQPERSVASFLKATTSLKPSKRKEKVPHAPLLPTNQPAHRYKVLSRLCCAPCWENCFTAAANTAQSCKETPFILFENTFVFHTSRFLFASYKRNLLSQASARLRVPALPSHLGIKKTCVIAQWTVQAEGRKATDIVLRREKTREE